MKSLLLLLLLAVSPFFAYGQTKLVAAGLSFGSTVGDDFSGHSGRVGGFGEAHFVKASGFGLGVSGVATLESAPKSGTSTSWEFRGRPEVRAYIPAGPVRPFAGGGVEYVYFNSDQYSKPVLNPILTVGLEISRSHTLRASRLFTDQLNGIGNDLRGWRYGYDLAQRFKGTDWGIRFSGEFNRFYFEQPYGPTKGEYSGNSLVFRLGLARLF